MSSVIYDSINCATVLNINNKVDKNVILNSGGGSVIIDNNNTESLVVRNGVGNVLTVDTVNSKVLVNNKEFFVVQDILLASYSGSQGIIIPTSIPNLKFSETSISAFTCYVSIEILANTNLYEQFEIKGIKKGIWEVYPIKFGDNSLVNFSIISDSGYGQIQYTSSTYPGFTSMNIKFRAIVF